MKKVVVAIICMLMLSSVAWASPLMDFSAGKGSIDLTYRNSENSGNIDGSSMTFDKKYNLDGAITIGLGNKFAFQYRNFEPKSDDTLLGYGYVRDTRLPLKVNSKIAFNEFNVLYKVDKNVAAFAGLLTAKGTLNFLSGPSLSTNTKNLWQVGLVGSTSIADKTTLWGSVGVGSNLTNWEVGVSYAFAPSWEFNVNYREIEAKKLSYSGYDVDAKSKGLGLGLTYKF
ncbi:MAG: hypothetical protein P4N41_02850 [Negativicutes bacterium]|nr:hypothetical protein [Negativicutes bacterium]